AGGVALLGASGVGKSALAEALAEDARAAGALVLTGQAPASDRVPFGALHAALDRLRDWLHAPRPQRLAPAPALAAHGFPMRGRDVPPLAFAPARRAVFDAVAELLDALGGELGRALVVIDDLQWADEDCLALLDHLLSAGSPHVRVLATVRDDASESA